MLVLGDGVFFYPDWPVTPDCTMFRIVNIEPLIPLWVTLDKEATDDEHMKCLINRFGKVPDDKCTRANQHIDKEGGIIDPDPDNPDSAKFGDLWQPVQLAKPKDLSEDESRVFYDLLKKMLNYDPRKRLSTKQALEHPWFPMLYLSIYRRDNRCPLRIHKCFSK